MRDVTKQWLELAGGPPSAGGGWEGYEQEVVRPLARLLDISRVRVVGMAGPPGSGKSTLARMVADHLPGKRVLIVSLDDFYLSRADRKARGLAWRGPPGSHDLQALSGVLDAVLRHQLPLTVPRFSSGLDDRIEPMTVSKDPDLFILEGWYVGYRGKGYEVIVPFLDLLVYLDVDTEVARERRFGREESLRREGRGFTAEEMERFWNEVLGPGIESWGAGARSSAGLVIEIDGDNRLRCVETASPVVTEAISGRGRAGPPDP